MIKNKLKKKKKSARSFPTCAMSLQCLYSIFHMLSTRPTDFANSPYPHGWDDLSPKEVSTQKSACLTVLCASLPMRLWIIVVIAETKWVLANYIWNSWCAVVLIPATSESKNAADVSLCTIMNTACSFSWCQNIHYYEQNLKS